MWRQLSDGADRADGLDVDGRDMDRQRIGLEQGKGAGSLMGQGEEAVTSRRTETTIMASQGRERLSTRPGFVLLILVPG